ncbi:MAG TPA: hypothetical protein VFL55_09265 [Acetobacteraceae bacterium]|nr:hypothetical protein [Acetobacteraceae bacterium]
MMARQTATFVIVSAAILGPGHEAPAQVATQAAWTLLMPTSHGLVPVQGFDTKEACRSEGATLARSKTPASCTEMACTFVVYCLGEEAAIYGR